MIDKCAHSACHCPARMGTDYCSKYCEFAVDDLETVCGYDHPEVLRRKLESRCLRNRQRRRGRNERPELIGLPYQPILPSITKKPVSPPPEVTLTIGESARRTMAPCTRPRKMNGLVSTNIG